MTEHREIQKRSCEFFVSARKRAGRDQIGSELGLLSVHGPEPSADNTLWQSSQSDFEWGGRGRMCGVPSVAETH